MAVRSPVVVLALALLTACLDPQDPDDPSSNLTTETSALQAAKVARRISTGRYHTCAITWTGDVQCWGSGTYGQLGQGSTTSSSTAVTVPGVSGAVEIAAGHYHTCARLGDGTIRCWGHGAYGQLGDGASTTQRTAVAVTGIGDAVALSAGGYHTCAVRSGGGVRCWGRGDRGQLGNGAYANAATSVSVSGLSGIVDVAAGGYHTCARTASSVVRCWGRNSEGQLGRGGTADSAYPGMVGTDDVAQLDNVIELTAGLYHTCAIAAGGGGTCWGNNAYGQLGRTGGNATTPVTVLVPGDFATTGLVAAAAGLHHTCFVNAAGSVLCTGRNTSGQLGTANTISVDRANFTGWSRTVQVSGGADHTCATRATGSVSCAGGNGSGQLGNGTWTDRLTPVTAVGVVSTAAPQIAKSSGFTCGIDSVGKVRCWGGNRDGQLGNGTTTDSMTPVSTGLSARGLSVGSSFACAVTDAGRVSCWGDGFSGQLGNGGIADSPVPVAVQNLGRVLDLSAQDDNACAVQEDGKVYCWGSNGGQLCHRDIAIVKCTRAYQITGIAVPAVGVAVGAIHACALGEDRRVYCWGNDAYGQAGDGDAPSGVQAAVGIADAIKVVTGANHSCALVGGGRVKCWGHNNVGQIGDGTTTDRFTPVLVPGLTGVVDLQATSHRTCAVRVDGSLWCWGRRIDYSTFARSPEPIAGVSGAESASLGFYNDCYVDANGAAWCRGRNWFGELGDGTSIERAAPVRVLSFP